VKLNRTNFAERGAEVWRPPLFKQAVTLTDRLIAALRRFLDLQAGSIWRDLAILLPEVKGVALDVGCGAQPYRPLFGSGVQYIGIDTADAEAHFGYQIPGTRYFTGDTWPIDDASVDFVLCTETLEHIPEPVMVLDEARRCLKNGGTLLLTVPFAARWHFIPYDYWRFTPSGLTRLLHTSHFTYVRVYARGNAVTVACYKAMALILRLAMPQVGSTTVRVLLQILSIPFIPVLAVLAMIANLSLLSDGGDDCLGYTALARKEAA
jgi:SAM-dependent methyltransferase